MFLAWACRRLNNSSLFAGLVNDIKSILIINLYDFYILPNIGTTPFCKMITNSMIGNQEFIAMREASIRQKIPSIQNDKIRSDCILVYPGISSGSFPSGESV